jgi:hypothetical protein
MSIPISHCLVSKAGLGDEQCFTRLVEAMDYNQRCGHFSTFPCEHDPRCPSLTEDQESSLNQREDAALEKRAAEQKAKQRPVGNFAKWVFPVIKNFGNREFTEEELKVLRSKDR